MFRFFLFAVCCSIASWTLVNCQKSCSSIENNAYVDVNQLKPRLRPLLGHDSVKFTNWHRDRVIFDQNYYQHAVNLSIDLLGRNEYDQNIMPIFSSLYTSPELPVGIHFRLMEVTDLNTYEEDMSVVYSLQLFWYDPRLAWYIPQYDKDPNANLPEVFSEIKDSKGRVKELKDIDVHDVTVAFHRAVKGNLGIRILPKKA